MKRYLSSFIVTASIVFASMMPTSVGAINVFQNCPDGGAAGGTGGTSAGGGSGAANSSGDLCGAAVQDDFPTMMKTVISIILFILGIIAVLMIVIGGVRYTTSNGESQQIKSAKDTIMYSVIGLIVAIMAYAIVGFIIDSFI